jgi:hypothetical protein
VIAKIRKLARNVETANACFPVLAIKEGKPIKETKTKMEIIITAKAGKILLNRLIQNEPSQDCPD